MIKLVAFDWNGTILADTSAVVAGDNAVLKHFNHPKTDIKEVRAKFTMPIRDFYFAMGLDPKNFNAATVSKIFYKAYEPLEQKCRTRAGAQAVLKWLKSQNISTVVFSNHIIPHIEKQSDRLKIARYIDKVLARPLGDISHMHTKSKDLRLKQYVRSLKLKPSEVLTVGDTEEEIEIAEMFGFYSVGLTGGNLSTKRLKSANPDFLIHNLKELKRLIQKI